MTELTLREALERVFKYHREACPEIRLTSDRLHRSVWMNGEAIPLFSYRTNPKIEGMKSLELLGSPCALTVSSVGNDSLEQILFRELDVAEYLLGAETDHITAYRSGDSANLIVGYRNQTTAHMQLHSSPYGERQFRHELFTTEGMVCNRVVDTVIAQNAMNIYTERGYEYYTDADILLYGLKPIEQEEVYGIYDSFHANPQALIARGQRLERIVDAAFSLNRTCHTGEDF
ncbi:MAG: hypothetical protein RSD95_13175 [Clostridia bacterium]